jgi:hypothetical protein
MGVDESRRTGPFNPFIPYNFSGPPSPTPPGHRIEGLPLGPTRQGEGYRQSFDQKEADFGKADALRIEVSLNLKRLAEIQEIIDAYLKAVELER